MEISKAAVKEVGLDPLHTSYAKLLQDAAYMINKIRPLLRRFRSRLWAKGCRCFHCLRIWATVMGGNIYRAIFAMSETTVAKALLAVEKRARHRKGAARTPIRLEKVTKKVRPQCLHWCWR